MLIEGGLWRDLWSKLRDNGGKCRSFGSNLKVWAPAKRSYFYPDATIVCGELQMHDSVGDVVENPLVVFEVLSPSTERYDRTAKFDCYRSIESLRHYVLVFRDEPRAEVFTNPRKDFGPTPSPPASTPN